MADKVGFNLGKAKKMQDDIEEAFNQIANKISNPWNGLQTGIRGQWVGEDEYSFEVEFVKKMNTLYGSAKWVSDACIRTIQILVENWAKFQDNNVFDNQATGDATFKSVDTTYHNLAESELSAEKYQSLTAIDTPTKQELAADAFRGLVNGKSSAQNIVDKLTNYVKTVRSGVENLFSTINANNAFYGTQLTAINNLKDKCAESIETVVTAVSDMKTGLYELAGARYNAEGSGMDSVSAEAASTASTAIENSVDGINTRWTDAS